MPTFRLTTPAQFRQRLRQEFQAASGARLHRMAKWIDANLTDAQLKNAFNLTDAQTAALRARLQDLRSRIEAVDAEVGS